MAMDSDDLRKSFIEYNKKIEVGESGPSLDGPLPDDSNLIDTLAGHAKAISAQWRSTSGSEKRHLLERAYKRIDEWIGELRAAEQLDDPEEKTKRIEKIRRVATERLPEMRGHATSTESFQEKLERELKRKAEEMKAGAGENTHTRIRNELNQLINNYTVANDARIEALIDQWRTSGDPQYSPEIRLRFRKARIKKSSSEEAF